MKKVRNVAFVLMLATVVFAADRRVSAFSTWSDWFQSHGCSWTDWYPWQAALTGWCDCQDGEMGCSSNEEFCSSFEGPCGDYCWAMSCGYGEVSTCLPDLVGFIECSCDFCT
jgi:hypothetical protein